MDSAQLDADTPTTEHGVSRSHAGLLEEKVIGSGRNGTATRGIRNGIQTKHTEERQEAVNGGAGAVALRRPVTVADIAPAAAPYAREHGLLARSAKRAIDLIGAILLLTVLTPVWLGIALLIKFDSPGPILFRQRRIGRDGRPFWMLKFRTMVDGADDHKPALLHLNEAAEGLFKINGDPRVTRTGRWLRATSLDELPQLLHVVTGRMSLVGPRPLVPEEDAQIVGDQRARLQMRPGMTGAWQVAGASSIPIKEMVVLDQAYVQDWSLLLDAKLLLQTATHVALRRGL
jgi:lipopolysaccharide/colanic/teichoic acid biosynthesis glycosyltransferase